MSDFKLGMAVQSIPHSLQMLLRCLRRFALMVP